MDLWFKGKGQLSTVVLFFDFVLSYEHGEATADSPAGPQQTLHNYNVVKESKLFFFQQLYDPSSYWVYMSIIHMCIYVYV